MLQKWKKLARQVQTDDSIMHANILRKQTGEKVDGVLLQLPNKRMWVSNENSKTPIGLAEVVNQPCQLQ